MNFKKAFTPLNKFAKSKFLPKANLTGFTLIELLIVITIVGILLVGVVVPYNFYSNIAKVRISQEILIQAINEAKSNAFGLQNKIEKKNADIALVLENGKNEIKILSYPFSYSGIINSESTGNIELIKTVKLESGVNISNLNLDKTIIVYFKSPSGDLSFYEAGSESNLPLNQTGILVTLGFKGAVSGILSKEIEIK